MLMPQVSVIVPNFNHARYLKQRIDSILKQTFQDFELILLDDCSADNSRELLLSYKDNPHVSQIVLNEKNSGSPFKQWDKGVQLAKGEWIWIAESDDWADEDFLEVLMSYLKKYPDCGLAYTLAKYMFQDKIWCPEETSDIRVIDGKSFNCGYLLFRNGIYNASMAVFRKSLYDQVDTSLFLDMTYCGDWMLYAQLCKQTSVLFINEAHSYFRQHDANTTKEAEHQGRTFFEGLKVVNFIANEYNLPSSAYSRHWGKLLAKYERNFRFDITTRRKVKEYVRKQTPVLYPWYLFYRMRMAMK